MTDLKLTAVFLETNLDWHAVWTCIIVLCCPFIPRKRSNRHNDDSSSRAAQRVAVKRLPPLQQSFMLMCIVKFVYIYSDLQESG